MPGRTILPVAVALLVFIVGALALNLRMIEVNVTGPSPPVANKLKIDVIPEDVIVNEEVKIVIKDPEGSPIEEAKVYVAKNYPSTKGIYRSKPV